MVFDIIIMLLAKNDYSSINTANIRLLNVYKWFLEYRTKVLLINSIHNSLLTKNVIKYHDLLISIDKVNTSYDNYSLIGDRLLNLILNLTGKLK